MAQVVDSYLNHLNEDFSFVNKVFKANILSKIGNEVKDSVQGNRINVPKLQQALKPIPSVSQDKIKTFLSKYLPNFNHNQMIAKKYFDNKYPEKPNNDTASTISAMLVAADDSKTIQNSIKDVNRVYSRGGSGGGAFVLMIIGIFVTVGAFSIEGLEFKIKALAIALGALLILSSFKSLAS